MRILEIKDLDFTRKVQLVLLLIVVSSCCCTGRPQMGVKCRIQSFFRARQGNGVAGKGNLLRVHLHTLFSHVNFTGSCDDPATTEFLMKKKDRNGSIIVQIFSNATGPYHALAIRNKTLVMEHVNNLKDRYEFVLSSAPAASLSAKVTLVTLKSVLSPHYYVKTDKNGKPLVGKNPFDVATWFVILDTSVCDA